MEPLWSPVVATGGNRTQTRGVRNRANKPKTIAVGCDGKEGVDGSSPSEGFEKFLQISSFCLLAGRRLRPSASTERPPPLGIAFAEGRKGWSDAALRSFESASTQRPPPARARARRAARRHARGCHGRGGRSGDRSLRCSSP